MWRVEFPAMAPSTSNAITVTANTGGAATLSDVAFGLVFLCSGQSNMQLTVVSTYNATEEIGAAGQYGEALRLMSLRETYDQYDERQDLWPGQVSLPWSRAANATVGGPAWDYFSATCYYTARNLYDLLAGTPYQQPIGLVVSSWGGTAIEAWMSAAAFAQTGEAYSWFSFATIPNSMPSSLWNAMINPLTNLTIDSVLWYQAESNIYIGNSTFNRTLSAANYSNNEPIMVSSWRETFSSRSKTSPDLPFGFVQLAGYGNSTPPVDVNTTHEIAEMRFAQNGGVNFAVPNAALGATAFRANAYDLADPVTPVNPPPYGDIHPRYKEQVGYRLAVAAIPTLFPGAQGLPARIAPFFTNCSVGQNSITAIFTNTAALSLFWNANAPTPGFDVRDATNTWFNTSILSVSGSTAVVQIPAALQRPITGVRYAWWDNPCCPVNIYSTPGACPIQNCALYDGADVNRLPVNPFTADIAGVGANVCQFPAHPFSY
jgi:sialate O-acetylesterase